MKASSLRHIVGNNHMIGFLILAVFIFQFLPIAGSARDLYDKSYFLSKSSVEPMMDPYPKIAVHNVGKIGLTVTNYGQFGLGGSQLYDPLDPGTLAPSCIYPYPGQQNYLFWGGLWIGAIVGNDTLVSVGIDGWVATKEMWPDPYPRGDIEYRSNLDPEDLQAVSEQDIIALYTDTCTNPVFVTPDAVDGRPHIPLEVEIIQKSHAWSDEGLEDFIVFEYLIKNIGDETLNKAYLGLYVDGDVGQVGGAFEEAIDDICGFKETIESPLDCGGVDTINLAWIADNNGRFDADDCPYGVDAVTSVTGVSLLKSPVDSPALNFNWWISNGSAAFDFGPRMAGTEDDPFRDFGGFLGTPMGDRNKYYILSHPEVDYDQIFSAVDMTANGWLPPAYQAADFSNGYDTRYLYSFGPFNIQPGEVLPVVFAYVAGENFHTDCDAYNDIFDIYSPEAYYETFNFDDIGQNALKALWRYDIPGVDTDGDGYAGKYRMCGDDTIYYRGDGVSDLIPYDPYPPSIRIETGETTINIKWNGLKPEATNFDNSFRFEGYKIYLASGDDVDESDYELIADYDFENYHRYFGTGDPDEWIKVNEFPMTPERIKSVYGIDNPEDHDIDNPFLYGGTYYYFEPAGENNDILSDPSGIHKLYPSSTYPSTENPKFGEPEELTDDGFLKYFEYAYTLSNLDPGQKYYIDVRWLRYIYNGLLDENSIIGSPDSVSTRQSTGIDSQDNDEMPSGFKLAQNQPNPFNLSTEIRFALPRASAVKLEIYNILGQRVSEIIDGFYEAGEHSVLWNGMDSNGRVVSSGVYFYKLNAEDFKKTKKMLLLK